MTFARALHVAGLPIAHFPGRPKRLNCRCASRHSRSPSQWLLVMGSPEVRVHHGPSSTPRLTTPGPSRCFPFWQEVLACYVVNTNSEDDSGKKKCAPVLEDYYECAHQHLHHPQDSQLTTNTRCLHHKKEAAKILALQHAYRKREAETSRDNAPSAGQIRSLGLLDKSAEGVAIDKGSILPTLADNMARPKGDKPIVH